MPNLLILYKITLTKFLVNWDAKSSNRSRRTWFRTSSLADFKIFDIEIFLPLQVFYQSDRAPRIPNLYSMSP